MGSLALDEFCCYLYSSIFVYWAQLATANLEFLHVPEDISSELRLSEGFCYTKLVHVAAGPRNTLNVS